ncbi:preprotein translocase subunit SecY [Candidatus Nanohalococcus occultus]|uniref:Protein translocase subunit SecY n=1 Tax=Candidatus Nanohalococcus occultus TaxID=2978047 RepID=A0ABY8CEK7_9ARCH|nr:Preprotein translocase subunit SecY [Candidatus Nanohaloarchaeota archaeon SVXNc]
MLKVAGFLPSVREPEQEQSLKEMMTWTGVVIALYFLMGAIPLYGANSASVQQAIQQFQTYQTLLGAQIGTILTLGIGPIVTSSIILQMLVGSELLGWNTNTGEGKAIFQASQKVLAYSLAVIEALGYVLAGTFGNIAGDPFLVVLLAGQITLGAWLIILMDDLVQKWGFGSGVSLLIAAGVAKSLYVSLISPLASTGRLFWVVGGTPVGQLFKFATTLEITTLIPVASVLIVFSAAVYLQSMRVEIPLTLGNVRGFGQKWPLKFLYTSNMPVILLAALISNFQILGSTLAGPNGCSVLGCFSNGHAISGIDWYLTAPTNVVSNLIGVGLEAVGFKDIIHFLVYDTFYMVGGAVFSVFWMRTSGQDAETVAQQIQNTGMKVPGFRRDTRVIKKVLNRYIPALTVMSGATVGLIAAFANETNPSISGTGILLTVMIMYQMYEQLAQKHMEELHPSMKEFFS